MSSKKPRQAIIMNSDFDESKTQTISETVVDGEEDKEFWLNLRRHAKGLVQIADKKLKI